MIADLGSFRQLSEVTSNLINLTADEIGMVEYIEPQHFKIINYKKNEKSDIYSLGVLLWEISSGHLPFPGYPRDVLGSHISYMNLREKPIEGTPFKYQQLYQKCWDDNPNSRPNIEEVYEILFQLKIDEFPDLPQSQFDQTSQKSDINIDSKQSSLSIPGFHNSTETS